MIRNFLSSLCFILVCCAKVSQGHLKIVGGYNATIGEFPYMVSLRGENQLHYCGGSIIGDRWVLTAAHCTQFAFFVRYGSIEVNDGGSDGTMVVKNRYEYPGWFSDTIDYNDLGLLELEDSLKFDENTGAVKLPAIEESVPYNSTANLTGWGFLEDYVATSILQKVELTMFYDSYCYSELNASDVMFYNDTMNICAGDWNNQGKGQCTMDSGGPLVAGGIQWGVVSWSYKPCGVLPGAFTKLANKEYRQWIKRVSGI